MDFKLSDKAAKQEMISTPKVIIENMEIGSYLATGEKTTESNEKVRNLLSFSQDERTQDQTAQFILQADSP